MTMDNNNEKEVFDNKAKIRMNDTRIQAVINLLCREGVFTRDEVKEEINNLLEDKDED